MSHTNGTHDDADASIDSLYAWMPPPTPAAAPSPAPVFSLTLKGKLGGQDALLTIRGMSAAEFQQNLQAMQGLLDSPQPAPAAAPGEGYCVKHQIHMTNNEKDGRRWYSHRLPEGGFCKGK